jgi:hypothetical protein
VIDGNPFASIGHVREFHALPTGAFDRLIFMPESFLSGKGWHIMVPEQCIDGALGAHRSFYATERVRK